MITWGVCQHVDSESVPLEWNLRPCISNKHWLVSNTSYPSMRLVHGVYGPYGLGNKKHLRAFSTYSYSNIKPLLLYLTCKMTISFSPLIQRWSLFFFSLSQVDHGIRFGQQTTAICQKVRLKKFCALEPALSCCSWNPAITRASWLENARRPQAAACPLPSLPVKPSCIIQSPANSPTGQTSE